MKAAVGALKAFPRSNAEIQGDEMVLNYYYDIGIAVGASSGLVVLVLRDADRMTFWEIEASIKDFAKRVEDGTLSLEEIKGGTFTITNGGVFGSLLSTPILNPPQVGILGLHKIEERPVARRTDSTSERYVNAFNAATTVATSSFWSWGWHGMERHSAAWRSAFGKPLGSHLMS